MTTRPLELALLGVVALFCLLLLVEAWQIRPPAHVFPLAVLITTLALLLLALGRAAMRPPGAPLFAPGRGRVVLAAAAGLALYALAMSAHYLAATFLFLFAAYLFLLERRDRRGVATAALVAAMATGVTWLTFSGWLGVNLP